MYVRTRNTGPRLAAVRTHAAVAAFVASVVFIGGVVATAGLAYAGELFAAALVAAVTFTGVYFTQNYAWSRFDQLTAARNRARSERDARAIASGPTGTTTMPAVDHRPIRTPDPGTRLAEAPVSVSGAFRAAVAAVPCIPTPRGARPERIDRGQDPGRHRPETLATTSAMPAVRRTA